jgi:DNA-binding NtrC family response regulator
MLPSPRRGASNSSLTSKPLGLSSEEKGRTERSATARKDVTTLASIKEGVISIAGMEERVILEAIRQTNGDKQEAAKLLAIGKTTIYRKLKEYGLRDPMRLGSENPEISPSIIAS